MPALDDALERRSESSDALEVETIHSESSLILKKIATHGTFFAGTLCASLASVLDVVDAFRYDPLNVSDDDYVPQPNPFLYWNTYKVLSVCSTTLYLMHSLMHGHDNGSRWYFRYAFGIATVFDLGSCILDDEDAPWPSFVSGSAAVHLFLLFAVVLMKDNYSYYQAWWSRKEVCFILIGDLLFLIGASIDVFISYWERPSKTRPWKIAAFWGLTSSFCWLIDSTMYSLADTDMFEGPKGVEYGALSMQTLPTSDDDECCSSNSR